MTSRERLLTALRLETPDRVPATVHQWQTYHLNAHLGGISDLEAFLRFGLDASITRYHGLPVNDPNWRVEYRNLDTPEGERRIHVTVATPGGTLENMVGQNAVTTWNITPLVKRHEDLELIEKYLPVPALDHDAIRRDREVLGENGILRGGVWGDQAGCWQHATCLFGTQELIMEAADHPDWVHAFLRALWEKKARFIEESLDGAPYDLIETGGGAASSTVISPKYYREFCLPYDRHMHDALHAVGHIAVYHTCGGMMPILDLIVENGCDASETLTPPGMGGDARPAEMKARIGDRVALIGGLDQNSALEVGTPEEVRAHVFDLFEAFGSGGGYIMSPSDHFFHVPPENLEAYGRAARECTYAA